jgi:site-specific DNA-methyltransferase (adenine-specific)
LATALGLPTPFYADASVCLYNADFRDFLEVIPACAAIITDPPYGETSLAWDRWPQGWVGQLRAKAPQLWCFGSFRMFLEHRDEFADWKLAQEIVWEKHNGGGMQNDRFRRVHELAAHFYHGEWEALGVNPVKVQVEEVDRARRLRRSTKPEHCGEGYARSVYAYTGTRLMRSVLQVPSCHGTAVHPTQKPEGIIRPLLEYSVPAGGLVLDPFAGSGTTLLVAKQMGRQAIGFELHRHYCEKAVARLAQQSLELV